MLMFVKKEAVKRKQKVIALLLTVRLKNKGKTVKRRMVVFAFVLLKGKKELVLKEV